MKMAWNKNTSVTVATLMNKTILAAAGVACCGTPRDERLCRTVAEAMRDLGHSAGAVGRKAAARREAEGIAISRSVANFRQDAADLLSEQGRHFEESDESDHEPPLDLEPQPSCDLVREPPMKQRQARVTSDVVVGDARRAGDMADQLKIAKARGQPRMRISAEMQKDLSKAVSDGVSSLPLFHRRKNTKNMKDLPASTMKSKLAGWLESEDGKRWKVARDERVKRAFEGHSDDEG